MSEKTEEQVAKDKAHVAAMKNAQAAMTAVLARCDDLERGLVVARDDLLRCKHYVGPNCYIYTSSGSQNQRSVYDQIDGFVANAQKVLG